MKIDQKPNPDVINKAKQILSEHFDSQIEIDSIAFLSDPERRNIVLRLGLVHSSKAIPKTVILKQSLPEKENDQEAYARFARDWAGLEFASKIPQRTHNTPLFYGGEKKHRFILIEDLGVKHVSLVDSLTLPNRDKAIRALSRFMKALGSFHAAGAGHTELYETILRKIHKDNDSQTDDPAHVLNDLINRLKSAHQTLNLSLSNECIHEAQNLVESILSPGPFTVLTHGDICPDNVFDHEENYELQLIDFEWAIVGNALLDGTYLRMSMPTCWCAKAIPKEVIESLELIYREEISRTILEARDDAIYQKAYTEACGFWILQQTLHFIDSSLENDRVGPSGPVPENSLWKSEENWVRPRVLSRLQAFIEVATSHGLLPHLTNMSKTVLDELQKRWPDAKPLEFYPAFQSPKFYIRTYKLGDEAEIYQLFYDTVHHINCKDYTEEQLDTWAPRNPDLSSWANSLSKNHSFVAIHAESNRIIGFADLEENGCLNRGYVHKDYQGQGIGKSLLLARENRARELGIKQLFSEVSITAKPFFEKCGYVTIKEQTKVLNGISFINYYMVKDLI
ncbi:TPA: GNAT family N-acetyltransferase [Legionella pneumophila]|uniref:GNAT family N-acetyltransferase n=1 Tax=Legionella pneumophila TaxID=446 RepID=UPI000AF9CCD6|nr:GNAT family N-acetyltransferase [Legionella pneumophila]MDW8967316.1 GNAT family N-acetyltransferase [Legionella pneumophila]MDW9135129.1 GNAT family N-acetyltransferase [Legionella pneumophila]MDW9141446.1 GNAT family N-acetyltransferase [Legionella pneumophila]MDW9148595.1 GNAT family N-acetyltransferase [Legionella pneumophila]MDW9159977.1 GNAT family N-acetyltransferase [Legionella pneumophila]